jgi:hypothetical protein
VKTRVPVVPRAHLAAWRNHVAARRRRARAWSRDIRTRLRHARERGQVTSAALIVVGVAGLLLGADTVAPWMLGLTAMGISGGMLYLGLNRDDGTEMPARGARSVSQVLDDERVRP